MIDSVIGFFIEPFSHLFMQRALVAAIVIGIVCSIFSCFLVLKGWSLMGDAVSHSVLPGLALSYITGVSLSVGAFSSGFFAAIFIGFIKDNSRVKEDAVMGIVFSGMFAFGVVLMTKIQTDVHLLHVLFGNILGISNYDFYEMVFIALLCALILYVKRKDFLMFCFDPIYTYVVGLKTQWMHFGLLILLSLIIVSALKAAGIILVIAMLIAPGATAYLLTQQFEKMIRLSMLVSVISCIFGLFFSFHWDTSTAPLIVIFQAIIFLMALFFNKTIRGYINE